MTESTIPDDTLVAAIRAGDEAAFLSLYRKLQAPIYRFALQMSSSRSVAEDVTQEVFLALIHRSAAFDPARGTLAAYLMGVARNCLLRRLRTDRVFRALEDREAATPAPESLEQAGPLSDIVRREMVQGLRQAVLSLPLHYREVLVLCELEERSYQEAAEILRCAAGTIRSRLHRARELLIEKLRTREARAEVARARSRRCPA
jgi:RNA polymerase sigma-70 factor (ECF subfamily)